MSKKVLTEIEKTTKEIRAHLDLYDERWQELRDFNQAQMRPKGHLWEEVGKDQMRGKKHAVRTATLELLDFKHVCDSKTKLETEMEGILRRLHRLRQQVIEWLGNLDLRMQEAQLKELRKQIELRYKRGKHFYRLGCSSEDSTDNADDSRYSETQQWIDGYLMQLCEQTDSFESEMESIREHLEKMSAGGSGKGKKRNTNKEDTPQVSSRQLEDRRDQLGAFVEIHKMHMRKLEGILRMLRNQDLEVDHKTQSALDELRELLVTYVEDNTDLTVVVAEEIYAELDLPAESAGKDSDDEQDSPIEANPTPCEVPASDAAAAAVRNSPSTIRYSSSTDLNATVVSQGPVTSIVPRRSVSGVVVSNNSLTTTEEMESEPSSRDYSFSRNEFGKSYSKKPSTANSGKTENGGLTPPGTSSIIGTSTGGSPPKHVAWQSSQSTKSLITAKNKPRDNNSDNNTPIAKTIGSVWNAVGDKNSGGKLDSPSAAAAKISIEHKLETADSRGISDDKHQRDTRDDIGPSDQTSSSSNVQTLAHFGNEQKIEGEDLGHKEKRQIITDDTSSCAQQNQKTEPPTKPLDNKSAETLSTENNDHSEVVMKILSVDEAIQSWTWSPETSPNRSGTDESKTLSEHLRHPAGSETSAPFSATNLGKNSQTLKVYAGDVLFIVAEVPTSWTFGFAFSPSDISPFLQSAMTTKCLSFSATKTLRGGWFPKYIRRSVQAAQRPAPLPAEHNQPQLEIRETVPAWAASAFPACMSWQWHGELLLPAPEVEFGEHSKEFLFFDRGDTAMVYPALASNGWVYGQLLDSAGQGLEGLHCRGWFPGYMLYSPRAVLNEIFKTLTSVGNSVPRHSAESPRASLPLLPSPGSLDVTNRTNGIYFEPDRSYPDINKVYNAL